jgi:hypothetical protein
MMIEHFCIFEMLIKFVGDEYASPELKAQCPFLGIMIGLFGERGCNITLHPLAILDVLHKLLLKRLAVGRKGAAAKNIATCPDSRSITQPALL